jgi:hypothetical protein
MKHALTAASLVLVAGLGAACGGGDDPEPAASASASASPTASDPDAFCEALNSLFEEFADGTQPTDRQAVRALKRWAGELEGAGPPEDMPSEAREGYELIVETVTKVEDDATQAEIQQQMTEGFTKADRASTNAFGAWAQETCPPEPPAGAPSEDESPTAP